MRDVSDAKKIGAIKYTLKIGHSDGRRTASVQRSAKRCTDFVKQDPGRARQNS